MWARLPSHRRRHAGDGRGFKAAARTAAGGAVGARPSLVAGGAGPRLGVCGLEARRWCRRGREGCPLCGGRCHVVSGARTSTGCAVKFIVVVEIALLRQTYAGKNGRRRRRWRLTHRAWLVRGRGPTPRPAAAEAEPEHLWVHDAWPEFGPHYTPPVAAPATPPEATRLAGVVEPRECSAPGDASFSLGACAALAAARRAPRVVMLPGALAPLQQQLWGVGYCWVEDPRQREQSMLPPPGGLAQFPPGQLGRGCLRS